jgi:polyisoprenoid-binding protein YceI
MRLAVAAAGAALVMTAAQAWADQQLLKAQSQITFTIKQMGVPVKGTFRTFDAKVMFEPKNPEASKVALSIDLASASLGSADTDSELAKPDWFHIKVFPQATFQSTSVAAAGPGKFNVSGKLAIKGSSRDVTVPISLAQSSGATTAVGAFSIKRLDFKIGDGEWKDTSLVADAVEVNFKLVLTGVSPM